MKICAKCQAACDDHMKFCLNCGEPFPEETITGEEAKEAAETVPELILEPVAETPEEPIEEAAAEAVEEPAEAAAEKVEKPLAAAAEKVEKPLTAAAEQAVKPAAAAAAAVEEEPPLTEEEIKEARKLEKEREREAAKIEAAKKKAEANAQKRAEKAIAVRKKAGNRQPVSFMAVLAIIFAIVGIFAGGYACLLSFMNLGIALIFYVPAVLGILFGFLALRSTGRDNIYRGKILACLAIVIGVVAIVLWIIGTFMLRHYTAVEFGSLDLMSAIRTLATKIG